MVTVKRHGKCLRLKTVVGKHGKLKGHRIKRCADYKTHAGHRR